MLGFAMLTPTYACYVEQAKDWPYSSFHRFVERGLLPVDWGSATAFQDAAFGERKD